MNNLSAVQKYFDAWNARDADAILASLTDSGTYEDPTTKGPIAGEAIRRYVTKLWQAFPDLAFVERSIGETGPDSVAAQWIMKGTNTGSMMKLPPSGQKVELQGADFFGVLDGKVNTVKGYFDSIDIPRQVGLNVIIQPFQIGPFRFGTSACVQTGREQEPEVFSITYLEARDDQSMKKVQESSRDILIEMQEMEGFIGATTSSIGARMVTVSAWTSAEAPRAMMKNTIHAKAIKEYYNGALAKGGYTSVWEKHRVSTFYTQCERCDKMNANVKPGDLCSCGSVLPKQLPYW